MKQRKIDFIIIWTARISSLVIITLFFLFFIGKEDFSQPLHLTWLKTISILSFQIGIVIWVILAWGNAKTGVIIGILSLFFLCLFDIFFTGTSPAGPCFLFFASPLFLFGISVRMHDLSIVKD